MSHLFLLFLAGGAGCPLLAAPEPVIDPARLIRESGGFLKKPEPAMSEAEQAVYEKVVPILTKRPEFALKLLKALSGTTPDSDERPSPAFEFMMGNAFYAVKAIADAEANYRSAVERNPAFVRAWNNLGVLYYEQDRYADAVPCFSKAVALGDRDPMTFGLLGNSLEKTGNTVSAERAYMQALAGDPANVNWTEGLLRLYLMDKQHGKAETLVRTLLAAHPREPKYSLAYVNLLLASQRKLEAIALLQRMSEAGLARDEDLGLLADLYAEQQMTPEAIAILGRLGASQPVLAEQKLLRMVKNLIADRSWSRGAAVLEALAKASLSPAGRIAYLEARVELEIARENWIGAKRELAALLETAPLNGNAWIGLGRVHLAETEQAAAIEAFERAWRIPESSYRASLELANLASKNRLYEQCLGYLEHALTIRRSPAVENFRDQIRNLIPPEKRSPP